MTVTNTTLSECSSRRELYRLPTLLPHWAIARYGMHAFGTQCRPSTVRVFSVLRRRHCLTSLGCFFLSLLQAWSDPSAKKLRRDMSNRVLGICKEQRRGALAVRLLQVGARLSPKGLKDVAWPGPGPYWAAMEAVRHSSSVEFR